MKIGICDYGIGGVGLYKLLRKASSIDLVYFSDAGYTPYGKVEKNMLTDRLNRIFENLYARGVTHIAVACNSASTVIPVHPAIHGIIEHGIELVLEMRPERVAVVGGSRTIESELFKRAFESVGIQTVQQVAQPLSIRIEAGDIASPGLDKDIECIFNPIADSSHILLACTHYPVIQERIQEKLPHAVLLDPVIRMAEWILNNWKPQDGNGTDTWLTSGNPEQMRSAAKTCFQVEMNEIQHITV